MGGQRDRPFELKFERPSQERPTHDYEGERNAFSRMRGGQSLEAKRDGGDERGH